MSVWLRLNDPGEETTAGFGAEPVSHRDRFKQWGRAGFAAAVVVLSLQSSGCMAHRPPVTSFYKLAETDSQYFLVPSGSSIHGQHQEFQISIPIGEKVEERPNKEACSIHGRWFSLYPATSPNAGFWTVETPSADAWAKTGGDIDMKPEWDRFLHEINLLLARQCFSPSEEFALIKRNIVESMSMPAEESLLYRYSYGQGGYVDLAPGMELRIERNIATSENNGGSPLRTIVSSYGFGTVHGNDVQMSLIESQGTSLTARDDAPSRSDAALAEEFKTRPHLRLILQRLEVSADSKAPARILGGSEIKDLEVATRAAIANPKITCAELRRFQVDCVEFEGLVTVSPVLDVKVNGRPLQVPLGSKVTYVFPPARYSDAALIKALRIQRRDADGYREIEFNHSEEEVGQILLFGGDEISWRRSKRH